MIAKERRTARREIYSGHVFNVYEDNVQLDNGAEVTREFVEHGGGVALLAITKASELLMVRQYRYGSDSVLLELPAGKIDPGESPAVCGARELEEETGYKATSLELVTAMLPTPAYCSEKVYIYHAKGLVKGIQHLDENEYLSVEKIPFNMAVEMVKNGEIVDAKTVVGILTYLLQQKGS